MAGTVQSLHLAETPFTGDGGKRNHKFLLRLLGDWTDEEVYEWLRNPQTWAAGTVERPDFTKPASAGLDIPIIETWDDRVLKDIKYTFEKDVDPQQVEVNAEYVYASSLGGAAVVEPPETGNAGIGFSFEVAPERIIHRSSLETMSIIAPNAAVFPEGAWVFDKAINVDEDGTIHGVSDPDAASQFTLTWTEVPAWWTAARIHKILRRRGDVNSVAFTRYGLTFDAGECRFMGASGVISGVYDSEVSFRFGIRENQSTAGGNPVVISGLNEDAGFDKNGWDLFWAHFVTQINTTSLKSEQRIAGGYVERLFKRSDLNELFV